MIKTGDRIRFLNSVGGGTVRKFQDRQTVLVEDENGFDYPVPVSECVVISESAKASATHGDRMPPAAEPEIRPGPPKQETVTETPEGEQLSVFLAFLPVDPKAMTQTRYESYFINNCNYYLYFSYASCSNNSWTSRSSGLIEPNTKIFMDEFGAEELNGRERVCVQFIAFKKNKSFTLKNAISVELRIDSVKFYKRHCFTENDFFNEPALLVPVIRSDVPEKQLSVSAAELQEAMAQSKRKEMPVYKSPVSKPKQTPPPTVEIDLHIHRLLDDTGGLSAGDILNFQLDTFRQAMQQHAGRKGQKIVFIHGKGEGVLRAAIEKELKTHYKSCEYQDASFREYGFGATLVKIR